MGQIAYHAKTGAMAEAFSAPDSVWQDICQSPAGTWLMPQTDWPATPKTSIRGLRFFAHRPGYPDKLPAPESYAHTRLKIEIALALRRTGYQADLEVSGQTPNGDAWIADVLARRKDDKLIAFEIQFSSQHLADFRSRTMRYSQSSVSVCWFMPHKPVANRLGKALCYENQAYYKEHGVFVADCEEIIPFWFDIKGKDEYPDQSPEIHFGRGQYNRRLTIDEAVEGMIEGKPYWQYPHWNWRA
ncbi:competence protein CoiA family protein [Oceaniovalibus sp. ACAM 378]|uniref:competence protein CoiA family protein n=1 Tax=Oceaniovalibus sp. ACAM 378 TaxID=2599923 RepID=UPI0011D9700A|nr:competence protein CoiA family protein [Oceaniovalibus sp. ACAM 378]TYB84223.1 hypothetical protein FQ320_22770 [Oceaniovalibus sp. ACAM 378]